MEAGYLERERDMSDFGVVSNSRGQEVSSTADARHMDQPDATFACDRGLLNPTPTLPMRPERRSGPAYDPSTRQSPVHLQYTTTLDGAVGPPARPGITTRREEVSDPRRLPAPDERYVMRGGASLLQNNSINSSSKISECKSFSCPSPNNKVSANLHYYKQGHGTNSAIL